MEYPLWVKTELEKVLGKEYDSIFSALCSLKSDVDSLMAKKHYAEETIQLISVVEGLFSGASYSAKGTPRRLRTIADVIEGKIKAEAPTPEEELKARYG